MKMLASSPWEAIAMSSSERKGSEREGAKPVRLRGPVYADLKRVARVLGKDIVDVVEDLIRVPLASLKGKLAAELAKLEKMEAAEAELAASARRRVTGG